MSMDIYLILWVGCILSSVLPAAFFFCSVLFWLLATSDVLNIPPFSISRYCQSTDNFDHILLSSSKNYISLTEAPNLHRHPEFLSSVPQEHEYEPRKLRCAALIRIAGLTPLFLVTSLQGIRVRLYTVCARRYAVSLPLTFGRV